MRWPFFLILTYVIIVIQCSLGRMLALPLSIGPVGPDLAAIAAVFVALYARTSMEAMLGAWTLGMALDLTTASVMGQTSVVGPMAIAFALSAGLVFRLRDAVFRERAVTQVMLTLGLCLVSHVLWLTLQALRASGEGSLGFGRELLRAVGIAVYSSALAPLVHAILWRFRRWLIPPAASRMR